MDLQATEEDIETPASEQGGVFDAIDAIAENPPEEADVEELVSETDRISELLADDPQPTVPLLEEKDEVAVSLFRARLREAAAAKVALERAWRKAFQDYNQQIDPNVSVWRSKLKLPYIRALVLSAIPSGLSAAFDSGTILKMDPVLPEHEQKAAAMEKLVQWQLTIKVPARKTFRHFLHYRALYGTGILRTGWRRETRMMMTSVPVYDEVDERGMPLPPGERGEYLGNRRVQKAVEIHDEPVLECVDLWNAFPCPWSHLDEIPYFIEREETTRENLLAAAKSGALGERAGTNRDGQEMTPEEAVTAWLAENPHFEIDQSSTEFSIGTRGTLLQSIGLQSPYAQVNQSGTEADPGPSPVVVYWYCTKDVKFCFSGDGKALILGKQANPYDTHELPYVISQYDEILPGFVWGAGIGMAAGPLQSQIDFDVNMGNDGRRLAQNPVLKRRRRGSALLGDIAVRPGAIIDVYEQDDVEQLDLDANVPATVEWLGFLTRWGDRATGIGDLQRGLSDSGVDTATEAAILDSNAVTRKLTQVFEIRDVWQRLGRLLVQLNKQFFNEEKTIRVAGKDGVALFVKITPEEILGEYDVVPGASMTRSDVVLQRRDWLSHFQMFSGDPLTNQHELRRRYWTVFDQENIDDLLQPPPPPPQDPMLEEQFMQFGIEMPVSPDDDHVGHAKVHALALQTLQAEPVKDPLAIAAHMKHMQEHAQMFALAQQQAAMGAGMLAAGAGGTQREEPDRPMGKVRERATDLGKQQGSHGQNGEAPGPRNPTGRPVRSMP